MVENNDNTKKQEQVKLYGKVAKFPKNVRAKKAYSWLENIHIPKKKLWYFIIERELVNDKGEELQIIKYNNKQGVNCAKFVESLKEHYKNDSEMSQHIENLVIEGNSQFSIIKNIPNIEIGGKKLISIITEDLIKLLYK